MGAILEEDYYFEGQKKICRENGKQTRINFSGFGHVTRDGIALESILHTVGPVSVQMGSSKNFQFYNSRVFRDTFQEDLDDFVALVVGYGDDPVFGSFWLIKNCWGRTVENRGTSGFPSTQSTLLLTELLIFLTSDLSHCSKKRIKSNAKFFQDSKNAVLYVFTFYLR